MPDWQHTSINDFARMLGNDDTRILDQALIALNEQTGIEGTVVTLEDRARHGGSDGLEPFATRLFNDWGLGDPRRNDGFMILVLRDDREARIELGAGYPGTADAVARDIMDRTILPPFRDGRMSDGIREGTLAVIDRIARPLAEGRAPERSPDDLAGRVLPLLVLAVFGLVLFRVLRNLISRLRHARRPCPACGGRGLVEEIAPVEATDVEGRPLPRQSIWTRCPRCGWSSHSTRREPRAGTRKRSGRFGGGRSSGGGSSGRW
nr:TPM domain-containing protein [Paracoccus salsus]